MSNWKDTIEEIFTLGEYTLLHYIKGDRDEWCCALHYNADDKTWDAGNYHYGFEGAIAYMLIVNGCDFIKTRYQREVEEKYNISYDRMTELATRFKDLAEDEDDWEFKDFVEEEMDALEVEFFGIELEGDDEE